MADTDAAVDSGPAAATGRSWRPRVPALVDVAVIATLTVVGFAMRRNAPPTDHLWFDDSWVAAGAALATPGNLLSTGSGHPAFTALLALIHRADPDVRPLAYPALVAGVLGGPALYAWLSRLGHGRAPSALLASALTVATIPALYAGRVKGYTLDLLLVIAIAAVAPWAAARRWGWRTATAWVAAALVVGAFSGYLLLTTALATFVVALHANGDRRVRLTALAVQGLIQGAYLRIAQTRTDLAGIEEVMEVAYDGHMELHANPVTMLDQFRDHMFRVMEVYPQRPRELLTLLGLAALTGLVLSAWRGRTRAETITGRLTGLMVATAVAGSLVERFPFGTSNDVPLSAGGRHTLWMVPAIAFGLSVSLDRVRSLLARAVVAHRVFDVALAALALVTLVVGYQPPIAYPGVGSAPAARMIDAELRPGDVVLVNSNYAFSFSSRHTDGVELTPDFQVGFIPTFDTDQIKSVGAWSHEPDLSPAAVRRLVGEAERVWVYNTSILGGAMLADIGSALTADGWTMENRAVGTSNVQLWTRD